MLLGLNSWDGALGDTSLTDPHLESLSHALGSRTLVLSWECSAERISWGRGKNIEGAALLWPILIQCSGKRLGNCIINKLFFKAILMSTNDYSEPSGGFCCKLTVQVTKWSRQEMLELWCNPIISFFHGRGYGCMDVMKNTLAVSLCNFNCKALALSFIAA